MEFIGTWIVTALATMAAITVVPGIEAVGGSYAGPLMCALSLALVNTIVKPIAEVLSLPLTIVTLGFFYLVVNALMLELASSVSVGLFGSGISIESFGAAFMGAIVISIVSVVISAVTGL